MTISEEKLNKNIEQFICNEVNKLLIEKNRGKEQKRVADHINSSILLGMFTYQSRILPSMYKSDKTRSRVSQSIFHSRTFRALTFSSIASVIRVNRARYPRRSWRPIMTLSRWIDCKPEQGAACHWLFRWTLNDIMKKESIV